MNNKLEIGGKERPLSFNFNCLEEFEERTGINALNGGLSGLSTKNAKILMFCAMKYGAYPEGCEESKLDFTLANVGAWIDPRKLIDVLRIYVSQSEVPEKKSEAVITQSPA